MHWLISKHLFQTVMALISFLFYLIVSFHVLCYCFFMSHFFSIPCPWFVFCVFSSCPSLLVLPFGCMTNPVCRALSILLVSYFGSFRPSLFFYSIFRLLYIGFVLCVVELSFCYHPLLFLVFLFQLNPWTAHILCFCLVLISFLNLNKEIKTLAVPRLTKINYIVN